MKKGVTAKRRDKASRVSGRCGTQITKSLEEPYVVDISHLNLLSQETSLKLGVKNKRLRAGWDEDYLLKILLE